MSLVNAFEIRQQIKIQDKLEDTVLHILEATKLVSNLAKNMMIQSCPFQLDVMIAYPDIRLEPDIEIESIDEKESENEEEEVEWHKSSYGYFGDIKGKIESNGLMFISMEGNPQVVRLSEVHNKYKAKIGGDGETRFKRLCVFIDRDTRLTKDEAPTDRAKGGRRGVDEVTMFEPIKEVRNIPHDAVPEWEFNAVRTCIVPKMKRNDDEKEDGAQEEHISAQHPISDYIHGQYLVVSFHVKSSDCIRCWLHANGQTIRFMPEDITDLLPQFFDLEKTDDGDYRENKKFVENERQKQVYRNQIKGKLMDSEYERFRELNAK